MQTKCGKSEFHIVFSLFSYIGGKQTDRETIFRHAFNLDEGYGTIVVLRIPR